MMWWLIAVALVILVGVFVARWLTGAESRSADLATTSEPSAPPTEPAPSASAPTEPASASATASASAVQPAAKTSRPIVSAKPRPRVTTKTTTKPKPTQTAKTAVDPGDDVSNPYR